MSTWTTEDREEAEKIMNNEPALKGEPSRKAEPVAWGMLDKDGGIYDSISPEEHDREEGAYTIPLYTHPAKELDEQFKKGFEAGKEEGWKAHKFHHPAKTLTDEEIDKVLYSMDWAHDPVEFARAILKKASEK